MLIRRLSPDGYPDPALPSPDIDGSIFGAISVNERVVVDRPFPGRQLSLFWMRSRRPRCARDVAPRTARSPGLTSLQERSERTFVSPTSSANTLPSALRRERSSRGGRKALQHGEEARHHQKDERQLDDQPRDDRNRERLLHGRALADGKGQRQQRQDGG